MLEICKRYLADGKTDDLYSEMNNLGESIHSTVNEIKAIIYDLKPSSLENGLIHTIQGYIEASPRQTASVLTLLTAERIRK